MRDVHLQRYARSTVEHYRFDDVSFGDIEGYEYYAGLSRNIAKHGLEKFNGFQVTAEAANSQPASPSSNVLIASTLPEGVRDPVPLFRARRGDST